MVLPDRASPAHVTRGLLPSRQPSEHSVCSCSCFAKEETEVQRACEICPRSGSSFLEAAQTHLLHSARGQEALHVSQRQKLPGIALTFELKTLGRQERTWDRAHSETPNLTEGRN